ncbi:MAG: serine/threonine-protein kinase [Planctomycetota bacterium]
MSSDRVPSLETEILRSLERLLGREPGQLSASSDLAERLRRLLLEELPESISALDPVEAARQMGAAVRIAVEALLKDSAAGGTHEEDVTPRAVAELGGDELEMSTQLFELERELEGMFSEAKRRARGEEASSRASEDDAPTSELLDGQYPDLSGEVLCGKYRVHRVVGTGGYGAVYEASDLHLGYHVAIKVLSPRAAPEDLAAFRDEARRVTRLSSPNIVEWKSFEQEDDGTCFFVMELLDGEDLETVIRREERLPAVRVVPILLQILNALRAAHELPGGGSVLHLDLKPKNVFLLPRGVGRDPLVKVIDFGIGQYVGGNRVDPETGEIEGEQEESIRTAIQRQGGPAFPLCRACTPEYAAPEQCAHLTVFSLDDPSLVELDGRADLYSLGILAYRMLTGEMPFEKPERRTEWLKIQQKADPKPLIEHGLDLPEALVEFVERCLEKDREARFASAAEAFEALSSLDAAPFWKRLFG